jgi:hypothetical protein
LYNEIKRRIKAMSIQYPNKIMLFEVDYQERITGEKLVLVIAAKDFETAKIYLKSFDNDYVFAQLKTIIPGAVHETIWDEKNPDKPKYIQAKILLSYHVKK